MKTYYEIDDTNYNGDKSNSGEIVSAYARELKKQTGISMVRLPLLTEENIYAGTDTAGIQLINEETLWENLTNQEKIDVIVKYLSDIGIKDEKGKLLIIDPYLFNGEVGSDYENLFVDLIREIGVNQIDAVIDKKYFSQPFLQAVQSKSNIVFNVTKNSHFHDRYWINKENNKAFSIGASLNRLGNKISRICMCDESDDIPGILENTLATL